MFGIALYVFLRETERERGSCSSRGRGSGSGVKPRAHRRLMLMSSSTALRALSGYRRLFRARRRLFAGDERALAESALAIRAEFVKNRNVAGHPPEHVEGLLSMIDEAEDMMLHGIIQGEHNKERNVVEVKISPEQGEMDPGTMTHIDPITHETGNQLDAKGKPKIEVVSHSGSSSAP